MSVRVEHGDMREVLKTLEDGSVSACITDPPYGLEFMGKEWDAPWQVSSKSALFGARKTQMPGFGVTRNPTCCACGGRLRGANKCSCAEPRWDEAPNATRLRQMAAFQDWMQDCAEQIFRVLKPGGHLLMFGGTRTAHRMACAIEDAGFEIRDTLMYLYGSGFPKSHNVANSIDKAHGLSNRGHRIAVANRHHPDGTLEPNGEKLPPYSARTEAGKPWQGWGTALKPAYEPIVLARKPLIGTVSANVLAHGTGAINIDGCRVDGGLRETTTGGMGRKANPVYGAFARDTVEDVTTTLGRWPANVVHDGSEEVVGAFPDSGNGGPVRELKRNPKLDRADGYGMDKSAAPPSGRSFGDSGNAARFFFSAQPSDDELLLWRAKATIERCNPELANTVDGLTSLSKEAAASALRDAVTFASGGSLKSSPALPTSATPSELRRLCEAVIGTILSLGCVSWRESPLTKRFPNGVHVRCAEASAPTATMTITASHWKSDGSAEPVTFSTMLVSTEAGDLAFQSRFHYSSKADAGDRLGSKHPTVKPVDLMRWLVRLVTPKGGTVLDPFAGSGTTGMACMAEGFDCILIEREAEYVADIRRRLAHVHGDDTPLFSNRP